MFLQSVLYFVLWSTFDVHALILVTVTPFKFAFTIVTTNVLCVFIICRLTDSENNSLLLFAVVDPLVDATTTTAEVDGRSLENNYFPTISGNTARLKNAVDLSHVFPKVIVWRYPLLVDIFLTPDNKVTIVNICLPKGHCLALPAPGGYLPYSRQQSHYSQHMSSQRSLSGATRSWWISSLLQTTKSL